MREPGQDFAGRAEAPAFQGRRVLLISARFFGYHLIIKKAMEGWGAQVQFVDERPGNSFWSKALIRTHALSTFARPIFHRYFRKALAPLEDARFDDVLIISPECCDEAVVAAIRRAHPEARLILYMWDSLANKGHTGARAERFIAQFDRALTFDEEDAARFGMILRPLFCSLPDAPPSAGEPAFLFSFVGTIHCDRFRILRALEHDAAGRTLKPFLYLYLPSRTLYWFYRLTKPEFRGVPPDAFQYDPLPYETVQGVFRSSLCIADIEHPGQRGLTMRSLEVLVAGRHLLTTNQHIRTYPFYRPDRVTVLDRRHPSLPEPLPQPSPLTPEEKHVLSLRGWCEELFRATPGAGG